MASTPKATTVPSWLRAVRLLAILSALLWVAAIAIGVLGWRGRPLADYGFVLALLAALACLYIDLWRRLSKKVGKNQLRYAIILGVASLILGLPVVAFGVLTVEFPVTLPVYGLFLVTQIALIGNALKGYAQAEPKRGQPVSPVTTEPVSGEETKTAPAGLVTDRPINRRWLWAVRITALLGPVILSAWAYVFSTRIAPTLVDRELLRHGLGDVRFLILPFMVVVSLPSIHILLRLAGRRVKKGLALAVTWGSAAFIISMAFLALAFVASLTSMALFAGVFMFTQAVLVRVAIRTYYLMGKESGDTGILVLSILPTLIYVFLLSAVLLIGSLILSPPRM